MLNMFIEGDQKIMKALEVLSVVNPNSKSVQIR